MKQGGSVNRLGGVTSRSYDGPVLARQIVTDLVSDIGLEAGPLDAIPADATIENFAFTGPADAALNVALQKVGVKYFSDGSVIRFRPLGTAGRMAQPDAPSVSISPATGLVGVPAVTDDGVEFHSFLNPLIQMGSQITISSENVNGRYVVSSLSHSADNWNGSFITAVDLRSL